VLSDYPGKEVKKGLSDLYRKVEKHLSEDENLLQVATETFSKVLLRVQLHNVTVREHNVYVTKCSITQRALSQNDSGTERRTSQK
jgi:hypothetical protein